MICKREFADPTSIFQISGDPEKKTVEIRLQKSLLTMTFTDRPIPPEDDSASGDDSKQNEDSSLAKTLLGVLKKAVLGNAADEILQMDDDEPDAADGAFDDAAACRPARDGPQIKTPRQS